MLATQSLYTYQPTTKKCLEGKKVYAMFMDDQLIGYRYKTPEQTIKKIQRVLPKMGVPTWNKATLLNGWYLQESTNTYKHFVDGSIIATRNELKEMPEGIIR